MPTIECQIRDGQQQPTHGNYVVMQDGTRVAAFASRADAERFVASLSRLDTVTVIVSGGCVQHVECPSGVRVVVRDYDIPPGGTGPVCTDEDGKEYQTLEFGETTFTVIGVYEDNWQTFIDSYQAKDINHAMEQAWSETEDDLLIVAVAEGAPVIHGWDYVQVKPEHMRDV